MKKKIAILGSTGSVGKNTLKVLKKVNKKIEVVFLSTNKNVKEIIKQAKEFKVKNIIINDLEKFNFAKLKFRKLKINIYQSYKCIDKILRSKKIEYSMISISGIDGLKPTLQMTKYSKNLAVVNKESLICGWNLIEKKLKKNNTNFIPIDSEHFSIFSVLKDKKENIVDKVYITASGGPFINYPLKKFNKIKIKDALKHPNWKMGKKITIDSSTLMNKVFEVIEAKNIFKIDYGRISILTHPKSYIHAIIKFNNGLTKIVAHEPDMKIPIKNSLDFLASNRTKPKSINFDILNNLKLKKVDTKKFPLVNLLKKIPNQSSLYETVLITLNDLLVYKFLDKKISYHELIKLIIKFSNLKEFQKFKKIKPKSVDDIYRLRDYVSSKINSFGI